MHSLTCLGMHHHSCACDFVHAGSLGAARSRATLKRLGISHIVNASPVVPCFHRHSFKYKTVCVYDDDEEDIMQHFHETNTFINEVRIAAQGSRGRLFSGTSMDPMLRSSLAGSIIACTGIC